MKMKLLAAALLLGSSSLAMAADAVVYEPALVEEIPVGFNWTGGYVGLHAGYGWGDSTFVDRDDWNEFDERFNTDPDGFIGGVQAGYNWQANNFVYGVEAEVGYLNLRGTATSPSSPEDTFGVVKGGAYGALSARLGYAIDRTLVYAKAGGVYSAGTIQAVDSCDTGDCGGGLLSGGREKIGFGYQVGAGVEHAITNNWTVKLEYSYFDFGKETLRPNSEGEPYRFDADLDAHTVKVGLNYKF